MELNVVREPPAEALRIYRGASDKQLLASHDCFIAEGRLLVLRALRTHPSRVISLLVTEAALRALGSELAVLGLPAPVFVVPADRHEALTGHRFHRGCLALLRRPEPIDHRVLVRRARRLVVLEGVANPDNVGGVFRAAHALGADAVLLDHASGDPLYRKALRTSMGSGLVLPYARVAGGHESWLRALGELREAGLQPCALSVAQPAVSVRAWADSVRGQRVALLVGAEGPGLSPASEALAACRVRVPMVAGIDSLNLVVATAIALHALT